MITRTIKGTYYDTEVKASEYDDGPTFVRITQHDIRGKSVTTSTPVDELADLIEALIDTAPDAIGATGLLRIDAAVNRALHDCDASVGELMDAYEKIEAHVGIERRAAHVYGRS